MARLLNRRVLGGALAALGLFLGVKLTLHGQYPGSVPPATSGQVRSPAVYQPLIPVAPSYPQQAATPVPPAYQPKMPAPPAYQPPVSSPTPATYQQPVTVPPASRAPAYSQPVVPVSYEAPATTTAQTPYQPPVSTLPAYLPPATTPTPLAVPPKNLPAIPPVNLPAAMSTPPSHLPAIPTVNLPPATTSTPPSHLPPVTTTAPISATATSVKPPAATTSAPPSHLPPITTSVPSLPPTPPAYQPPVSTLPAYLPPAATSTTSAPAPAKTTNPPASIVPLEPIAPARPANLPVMMPVQISRPSQPVHTSQQFTQTPLIPFLPAPRGETKQPDGGAFPKRPLRGMFAALKQQQNQPNQPPLLEPPTQVNPLPVPTNPPPMPANPHLADHDNKPVFDMSWENGLFFRTADGKFTFHSGAMLQYDFAWYSASPILEVGPGGTGKFNDGANVRRGRFFFEGTLYNSVDYKFELEFFNGVSPAGITGPVTAANVTNSPGPTDAWITIKDVPLIGNVRIGSQKEWFSLEHLNDDRYLEFMERSHLFDFSQPTAFNNGFTPGISFFRTWVNDRIFSAMGFYKNVSNPLGFGLNDGNYAFTGRLAALPIWMPDEKIFWHFGAAMSHRDPVNGAVQIRLFDNIRNAPFPLLNLVANTGLVNCNSQDLYNFETAAVYGPLTFQAEYTANILNGASVNGASQGGLFFQGLYVEGLIFLTGESRTWDPKVAFFKRVQPLRPLRLKPSAWEESGCGAWELGLRYSYIDLSNKAIVAGRLDSWTLGLNWYLNANAKLQFNYDYTQRGETGITRGHIHSFGTRMQVDF